MLSQLLPMLAITFSVFVLFFLFMGIGYMFKKQPSEAHVVGLPNSWAKKNARIAAMILINAKRSLLNSKSMQ